MEMEMEQSGQTRSEKEGREERPYGSMFWKGAARKGLRKESRLDSGVVQSCCSTPPTAESGFKA